MNKRVNIFLIFAFSIWGQTSNCENNSSKIIGRNNYEMIKVDLKNGIFGGNKTLPFDVPFILYGTLDSNTPITSLTIYYKENNTNSCNCDLKSYKILCPWYRNSDSLESQDTFQIKVPPLKANSNYQFIFKLTRNYNKHELDIINSVAKEFLFDTISNIGDITKYGIIPNMIKKSLILGYKKKLTNEVKALYPNQVDTITNSLKYWIDKRENVSQLDWSIITKQITVLKGELDNDDVEMKNAIDAWINLKDTISVINKSKSNFNFTDKSIFILSNSNKIKIEAAICGQYNIETNNSYKYTLITNLNHTNTFIKQQNIEALLKIFNSEYDALRATNIKNVYWNKFSKIYDEFYNKIDACSNSAYNIQNDYSKLEDQINQLNAEDYLNELKFNISFNEGNTIADFMTRAEYYITADFGLAFGMFGSGYQRNANSNWDEVLPYLGVNFSLFPINRQTKYKYLNFKEISNNPWKSWWYVQSKKISVIVGVTINSVEKNVNNITYRKGVVGVNQNLALISGIGYRIGDYVRISGGIITSKYRDQNILVEGYHLKAVPYLSISLDIDVKSFVNNIFTQIFPNTNL